MRTQSVRSSLTTAGAELQTGQGLLEKLAATQYNWKGKPFQATIFSAIAGVDALVWQLTASVIMPGFTINRVVTLSSILLAEYGPHDGLAAQVRRENLGGCVFVGRSARAECP